MVRIEGVQTNKETAMTSFDLYYKELMEGVSAHGALKVGNPLGCEAMARKVEELNKIHAPIWSVTIRGGVLMLSMGEGRVEFFYFSEGQQEKLMLPSTEGEVWRDVLSHFLGVFEDYVLCNHVKASLGEVREGERLVVYRDGWKKRSEKEGGGSSYEATDEAVEIVVRNTDALQVAGLDDEGCVVTASWSSIL